MSESDTEAYDSFSDEEAALDQLRHEQAVQESDAQPSTAAAEGKRSAIYNAEALHDALEDLQQSAEVAEWEDGQALTAETAEAVEDVEDDLTRELSFYNQALDTAKRAIGKFEEAGTTWLRPPDYYAEMVKSDDHMKRVKAQLMHEQTQLEAAEERRKGREAKKFSKAVQAERLKEKAQSKKAGVDAITRLRKQRQRQGFAGELDVEDLVQQHSTPARSGSERIRKDDRKVSKKRNAKDEKFGFGGRKRLKKQNDASSAADMEGFRPARFDDGVRSRGRGGRGAGGRGGSRGGSSRGGGRGGRSGSFSDRGQDSGFSRGRASRGKPNRPGKARRQAMRS